MKPVTAQARPYAKAVFQLAQKEKDFDVWSKTLACLSALAAHPDMQPVLTHPKMTQTQKIDCFLGAKHADLHKNTAQLIRLLAHYRRLSVLPEIAQQYEYLRHAQEHTTEATLTSAVPLEAADQQRFMAVLEKHFQQKVALSFEVDAALIGGATIRTQKGVIDGSLRGKLTQLRNTLSTI